MENHSIREKIDFLKQEFHAEDVTYALLGAAHSSWNYTKESNLLEKSDTENPAYLKIPLTWDMVEKRVSRLVKADRYLTLKSKEAYIQYQQEQQEHNIRIKCKEAIEKLIIKKYTSSKTPRGAAQDIINQYGWKRVECVLANTIVHRSASGHFSADNEKWAKGIISLDNQDKGSLLIHVPPAYLEIFTNQARRYQRKLEQAFMLKSDMDTSGNDVIKQKPRTGQGEEKQQQVSKAVEMEKQPRNANIIEIGLNTSLSVNSVDKTCHSYTIKNSNLERAVQYATLQAQKVPCAAKTDKDDGRISIKEKLTKTKEKVSLQEKKMPEVSKRREKEEIL